MLSSIRKLRKEAVSSLLSVLLLACGGSTTEEIFATEAISFDGDNSFTRLSSIAAQAPGMVPIGTRIYCPDTYAFDPVARLCVKDGKAIGPFPIAMQRDCIRFGGGSACQNLTWDLSFAKNLRGTDECPKGSTKSAQGLCVENGQTFGPFSQELVAKCREQNGGESCSTMRWSAAFAQNLLPSSRVSDVPYFCQLSNVNSPRSTCGNTSLAMALSAVMQRRITPDFLWTHNATNFGYTLANSRFRFAEVARSLGAQGSRPAVLTEQQIKNELDNGALIVMQGRFTNSYGHIVLIIGYNAQGFIVHDPFGRWRGGQTGSGYVNCGPSLNTGLGITYSYADMRRESLLNPQFSVGVIKR